MTAVVIVGAGGHGRVVLDILRAMGQEVAGFLDDERKYLVNDALVLGRCDQLSSPALLERYDVLVAIGDNAQRRRFAEQVRRNGGRLARAIHPGCIISTTA